MLTELEKVLWQYYCQFSHIENAYEEYERPKPWSSNPWEYVTYYRLSTKAHDFVNSTYHILIHYYDLDASKDWYIKYLCRKYTQYINPYRKKNSIARWSTGYWQRRIEAREKVTRYRRRPEHTKKELTEKEIAKRDWRKKIKDPRDQKYCRRLHSYFKVINKRTHRAHEKHCIATGQFDRLGSNSYDAVDPWGWD